MRTGVILLEIFDVHSGMDANVSREVQLICRRGDLLNYLKGS